MQVRKLASHIALATALAAPLLVSVAGVQICRNADALTAALVQTNTLSRVADLRADVTSLPSQSQSVLLARHGVRSAGDLDAQVLQLGTEAHERAQGLQRSTFLMLLTVLAALLSTFVSSTVLARKLANASN
jgi:hypothetical protein